MLEGMQLAIRLYFKVNKGSLSKPHDIGCTQFPVLKPLLSGFTGACGDHSGLGVRVAESASGSCQSHCSSSGQSACPAWASVLPFCETGRGAGSLSVVRRDEILA